MKAKRRSTTHRQSHSYQQLEDRRVMAGGITRTPIVHLPANMNITLNPGFELSTGGVNNIYQDQNVQGWDVIPGGGSTMKLFPTGSAARGKVLQIDHVVGQRDGIQQELRIKPGKKYLISFELRASAVGSSADPQTNDVEVMWNNTSLGVFRPTDEFRRYRVVAEATLETAAKLVFREVNAAGAATDDGVGAQLDNVQVVQLAGDSASNGDFEEGTTTGANPLIGGWRKRGSSPFQILGNGAPSGSRFLNLDGDATRIDLITQTFEALVDDTYIISFNARLDPNRTLGGISDQIRVRFGDQFAGSVRPNNQWNRFHIVVKANQVQNDLVFREAGLKSGTQQTGDGKGPWIDNIQVTRVTADWELGVDLNGSANGTDRNVTYTEGDQGKSLLNDDLQVFNLSRNQLTSAKVTLVGALNGNSESLGASVAGTNIQLNWDAAQKTLFLTGLDSVENYRKVLKTTTYKNLGDHPTAGVRTVRYSVVDKGAVSNVAQVLVTVVPVNDTPIIQPIADTSITAGTQFKLQVAANDPEGQQLFYSISSTGTALGSGETGPIISPTGEITWTPGQGGAITVTVTVRDTLGGTATEVFQITSLLNASLTGFVPFSGNRQLSFVNPASRNNLYSQAPPQNLDTTKSYQAVIATDLGELRLELFDNFAPNTVNNFIKLAKDGFYDGLTFHRVINDVGNRFVAQGGDPLGVGSGGPGYKFADEFHASLNFGSSGVLAMANSGPNTNGSQFFITYSPQTHLNNKHSIFGQLVAGKSVLDSFKSTATTLDRVVMRKVTIVES